MTTFDSSSLSDGPVRKQRRQMAIFNIRYSIFDIRYSTGNNDKFDFFTTIDVMSNGVYRNFKAILGFECCT